MKLQKIDLAQQDLIEIKEYLLIKGFELSKEDLKELKRTQDIACKKFDMVETDNGKFLSIIKLFSSSPYLRFHDYREVLKNSIFYYYSMRSKFDWHISDDELIKIIYASYYDSFGMINSDIQRMLHEQLRKEGYSNNDNQLDYFK